MNRTQIFAMLFSFLCFADTTRAGDPWICREDGVGPVKANMSLAQLSAALHQELGPDERDEHSCFYVDVRGHDHVSVMITEGKVARVDVGAPGLKTATGIQVGDTEAHARQVYRRRMSVTAHTYIDGGHYLTIRSTDGRYGIRFETENGKIIEFYAGSYDAIQYVEGCE